MISVFVYAENLIVRAGLESIISTSETLLVVGSSDNGDSLLKQVEELQPNVVLLEWLRADDEPVWENLLAIVSEPNSPAIVVLSDNSHWRWVGDALSKGVQALLPRSATADEIVAAIAAAASGLVVLHPDLVEELMPRNESPSRALPIPTQALTPREIEVLGMLALGLGNKTIAKRLGISEHTVKFHLSSIFTKLNASSRTEAVTLGARLGLIML